MTMKLTVGGPSLPRDLTVRYYCHMNVERCAHTKAIKCLYKHIHKGLDRTTVAIKSSIDNINGRQRPLMQCDKVKLYLEFCYVTAIKSC